MLWNVLLVQEKTPYAFVRQSPSKDLGDDRLSTLGCVHGGQTEDWQVTEPHHPVCQEDFLDRSKKRPRFLRIFKVLE